MKRFAVLAAATLTLAVTSAPSASAILGGAPTLVLQPATVAPGGTFSATLENCQPGGFLFNIENAPGTIGEADCGRVSPAQEYMDAPTAPGTYTVSAQNDQLQIVATATLIVSAPPGPEEPVPSIAPQPPPTASPQPPTPNGPGQPIPSTGPEQALPIAVVASVLVIGGIAVLEITQVRRRRSSTT